MTHVAETFSSIANAGARWFLMPGNLVCDAIGVERTDYRDLIRMLINSLFWMLVGILILVPFI